MPAAAAFGLAPAHEGRRPAGHADTNETLTFEMSNLHGSSSADGREAVRTMECGNTRRKGEDR